MYIITSDILFLYFNKTMNIIFVFCYKIVTTDIQIF